MKRPIYDRDYIEYRVDQLMWVYEMKKENVIEINRIFWEGVGIHTEDDERRVHAKLTTIVEEKYPGYSLGDYEGLGIITIVETKAQEEQPVKKPRKRRKTIRLENTSDSFRLSKDLKNAFHLMCKERGIAASALYREMMLDSLDEWKKEKES